MTSTRGRILGGLVGLALLGTLGGASSAGCGPRLPTTGKAAAGAAPSQPGATLYRCPMHHEFTSTYPKARCPKCHMFINEPVPRGAGPAQPAPTGADATGSTGGERQQTGSTGGERQQLIGVRRAKVERRDLDLEVHAAAVVAPDESRVAHIHTKLSGWITRLLVTQTGEPVRRGQPLLALYSEDLYRAQEEYLTLRRTVGGVADDAARVELQAAARRRLQLLDMPAAEIRAVEQSGVPRRDVMLRAPIAGVVLVRNVSAGSFVQPGTDLFVVADLSRVWALADVPEREAGGIRAGVKASVTFTAYPGEARATRVAYVYPSVAADTRTVRMRLELDNQDLKLKPGMFGEARLRLSLARALVVPAEAVVETGTRRYAFVVKPGGTFEPRRVETGRRVGAAVQVLAGLDAGEEIVASAGFLVDSESGLRAAIQAMH